MKLPKITRQSPREFYRNLPLYVFAGITLSGCLFIALTKLAGVHPFVSMLIPILLMIGYWGLASYLRRIRLHDEQTGDNLYYMGFLFTLSSLGVSLYQFTSDGSMDDVVRNFGIAITSTIFGIGMRILYNQTRRDVLDIERATRHDLATMTRRVRAELENTRREFADFRRVNNQMMTESFDEIIQHTDEAAKKMQASIDEMATEAIKPVHEASNKFSEAVGSTTDEIATKLTNISTLLEKSASKFESTMSKIEGVQLPEAVIKSELAPLVKEMGRICFDYAAKVQTTGKEQTAHVKEITDGFGKLLDHMTTTMGMMEKSIQATALVIQSNENLNRKMEQHNAGIKEVLEQLLNETKASKSAVQNAEIKEVLEAGIKEVLEQTLNETRAARPAVHVSVPPLPHRPTPTFKPITSPAAPSTTPSNPATAPAPAPSATRAPGYSVSASPQQAPAAGSDKWGTGWFNR